MRIGVDANVLARKYKTGVDYLTRGLLREAVKQMQNDSFYFCYFGDESDLGIKGANIFEKRIWYFPQKVYKGLFRFLSAAPPYDLLSRVNADVFFFPDFITLPLLHSSKKVVLIHDLSFDLYPQFVAPGNREHLSRYTRISAAEADHIVAISEATKKDVAKHYGISINKITVTTPAVDHAHFAPQSQEAVNKVKKKYGITKKYLLFTGTIEPRKNINGILDAYLSLSENIRRDYELVLAGKSGWLNDDIVERLSALTSQGVICTGYYPEEDGPALYSGASLYLFPSHYEGFGMPILEAMACGCPVITSNVSSMPEVAGGAAQLVDPNNPNDLRQRIESVLQDKQLAAEMKKKGLKRASEFTWEDSGAKLKQVFEKVAAE